MAVRPPRSRQHLPVGVDGGRKGGDRIQQFGGQAVNDSKGCGGVMRVAPFGLLPAKWFSAEWAFDSAAQAAGYTHGHPTGKLASGALAAIVHEICHGADLDAALDTAKPCSRRNPATRRPVLRSPPRASWPPTAPAQDR